MPTMPGSTGTMTAAQIQTALAGVQSYYLTLPHTSVETDLQNVAAHMTASGVFSSATLTNGGIDATFANGTEALIFADRPDDLGGTFDQSRVRRPSDAVRHGSALSAVNAHEVAFLVNESGDAAFVPKRQGVFGAAFTDAGFTPASGYGVDVLDITLENIIALGDGRGIDFLDINTHGLDDKLGTYLLLSTTQITAASMQTYAADLLAKRLRIGFPLYDDPFAELRSLPGFAFTGDFVTEHLTFNPGAIVDNESCWGQNVGGNFGQLLSRAGVGRYIGWTRPVLATDADVTDAFIIDRLLGEQFATASNINRYASQHTPPERAFPLDAIETAASAEKRDDPLDEPAPNYTYAESIPNSKAPSLLVITDYGGENVAHPPIEYSLPSIERLVADDVNGALDIFGAFPATPGTVSITNASGTATLTPTKWTTGTIVVPLPSSGAGANGLVSVTSEGITSNAVPLTQWSGKITYSTNDSIATWEGDNGSGAVALTAAFDVAFRADVHPTVVAVDTSPEPQNFAFTNVAPGSSGALTSGSGTFTSSDEQGNACRNCSIKLGLVNPQPTMVPVPTNQNQFFVVPESSQATPGPFSVPSPAPGCNDGQAGPGRANPYTACAFLYFAVNNPATCQITAGSPSYCDAVAGLLSDEIAGDSGATVFLAPSFVLTLDPTSYALTLSATPASFSLDPFGNPGNGTATVSGTFAVQSTPSPTTVSSRTRR
ncbi:MAG TPA: hypothetical protein VHT05_04240 [Candidatus Elarobacter sp.]|nr:hypothetical protein [Candidatus Elarobacter sp.]